MAKRERKRKSKKKKTMSSTNQLQSEAAALPPEPKLNNPEKTSSHSLLEQLSTGQDSELTSAITGIIEVVMNVTDPSVPLPARIATAASSLIVAQTRKSENLFYPEFQTKTTWADEGAGKMGESSNIGTKFAEQFTLTRDAQVGKIENEALKMNMYKKLEMAYEEMLARIQSTSNTQSSNESSEYDSESYETMNEQSANETTEDEAESPKELQVGEQKTPTREESESDSFSWTESDRFSWTESDSSVQKLKKKPILNKNTACKAKVSLKFERIECDGVVKPHKSSSSLSPERSIKLASIEENKLEDVDMDTQPLESSPMSNELSTVDKSDIIDLMNTLSPISKENISIKEEELIEPTKNSAIESPEKLITSIDTRDISTDTSIILNLVISESKTELSKNEGSTNVTFTEIDNVMVPPTKITSPEDRQELFQTNKQLNEKPILNAVEQDEMPEKEIKEPEKLPSSDAKLTLEIKRNEELEEGKLPVEPKKSQDQPLTPVGRKRSKPPKEQKNSTPKENAKFSNEDSDDSPLMKKNKCSVEEPINLSKTKADILQKYVVVEEKLEKTRLEHRTESVRSDTQNYCGEGAIRKKFTPSYVNKYPGEHSNGQKPVKIRSLLEPNVTHMIKPNEKHPLVTAWTLWYYDKKPGNWNENLKEIATFDTCEDLWLLHNHLALPSELPDGYGICIFRNGIRPSWEHPKNRRGGKWEITFPQRNLEQLDRRWVNTLFFLVSEITDGYQEVCGVVLSLRRCSDKFAIWTEDSRHSQTIMGIGHYFKNMLNAGSANCIYRVHADAEQKSKKYIHHI